MIGQLNPEVVRIDYTKIAEPLTSEQIADDISECDVRYMRPEELVMWEHQLDWLAKPHFGKGKRASYWQAIGDDAPNIPRPPEIFGIPVRLA